MNMIQIIVTLKPEQAPHWSNRWCVCVWLEVDQITEFIVSKFTLHVVVSKFTLLSRTLHVYFYYCTSGSTVTYVKQAYILTTMSSIESDEKRQSHLRKRREAYKRRRDSETREQR